MILVASWTRFGSTKTGRAGKGAPQVCTQKQGAENFVTGEILTTYRNFAIVAKTSYVVNFPTCSSEILLFSTVHPPVHHSSWLLFILHYSSDSCYFCFLFLFLIFFSSDFFICNAEFDQNSSCLE